VSPTADVRITHAPRGWRARLRRLPVVRSAFVRVPLVPRIVLASALLAVLVTAAFVVLVFALSELRTTTIEANRSKDVSAATLVLEQDVLQLDSGLRGFVSTGDARFLTSLRRARGRIPASIATLEQAVAGSANRQQRASRLTEVVHDYVEDYAVPLVGIARVSPTAAQSGAATAEGRRRIDDIRREVSRVLTVENQRSAARVSSATSQANRAIILGVGALVVSMFLVLLFGFELSRAVAHPVRRASEAAKVVAGGDLSIRLPEAGPAEVHDLSVAFNEMAESLERSKHELEAQYRRLEESERLRMELISAISHEVRTPLACVLGYTSLLQTRPTDETTRGQYLGIIADETRRLEALVEELVDVKRIEEGRLELDEEPFDLAALLAEQVNSFDGRSERHAIHFVPEEQPLRVTADRNRLAQVIANLLSNAVKYSPDGGAVEITAGRTDGRVRVAVRDHGIGISDEDRKRIFTKFFRGGAAGRGIGGMGLGLAVSRDIVEAHGGSMGFESRTGIGSTFWFDLPAGS
jgi:signal transduction histidine kinase